MCMCKTCTVRSCNSNCALIVHVSIIMAVIAICTCTCVCVCCNYLCDSVIVHCACLGSSSKKKRTPKGKWRPPDRECNIMYY